MKKYLLLLFYVLVSSSVNAQKTPPDDCAYLFSFDDTLHWHRIIIDTVNDTNNIWQIGEPSKTIFNSSYSGNRAILTDTLNTYPPNDTSSFTLIHIAFTYPGMVGGPFVTSFHYKTDTDTLFDYGKFELSVDKGLTWIDLVKDTTYIEDWNWYPTRPSFTGNSGGWKYVFLDATYLASMLNIQPYDTVLYRYTFISDSIDNHKDGWMIDDIFNYDFISGNSDIILINNGIKITPNPANEYITIFFSDDFITDDMVIKIYNSYGVIIGSFNLSSPKKYYKISIDNYHSGSYYCFISNKRKEIIKGKFIKIK